MTKKFLELKQLTAEFAIRRGNQFNDKFHFFELTTFFQNNTGVGLMHGKRGRHLCWSASVLYHLQVYFIQIKINFLLLKINFLLLKINFLLLKINFLLLKINFLLLKINFLLLKINFLLLKINFFLLKINFLSLKINFLSLKIHFLKTKRKFILMFINFQFNAIIDVFLCLIH